MNNALDQFVKADWKVLVPLLLKHALRCVREYQWSTTSDSLPEGQQLEDVVYGAIQKTLEYLQTGQSGKGMRTWDPAKVDLLTHLRGVVRSDINTLVNLEEHKRRDYAAGKTPDLEESQHPVDKILHSQVDTALVGESEKRSEEAYAVLIERLTAELKGDATALKYLMTVEKIVRDGGDPKYESIMKEGKLTFNDVRNSKRKVERAVARLSKDTEGKRGRR